MREARVLDLFSAAAGGWSLGMHRAGYQTVAACEAVEWRRILYSENNPGVPVYDDVCTLTADRLVRDLGSLPTIVVGSPPCQDISSANTKGKGVEGERSRLFFEAIRIIGEVRPRWFALENSANLRTRGADAVLLPSRDGAALRACAYAIAQKAESLFAPILAEKEREIERLDGERAIYFDMAAKLEARALAAKAERDTFKLALVAEKEAAEAALAGLRQNILDADVICDDNQKAGDRLSRLAAAIRARGE